MGKEAKQISAEPTERGIDVGPREHPEIGSWYRAAGRVDRHTEGGQPGGTALCLY